MRASGVGKGLFGLAVAGLAALCLVYGNYAPLIAPFPASLPLREVVTYASAAILLAASAGLFFAVTASSSAVVIMFFGVAWSAARARPLLAAPLDIGAWYGFAEALGPLVGVGMLYGALRNHTDPSAAACERARHVARMLFGAACVAYGAAHFAYSALTAAMVPAWLPGRLAVTYLTGAGHIAAGSGLLFGIAPGLAATLEAVMMTAFGVLVWMPAFFARPAPAWAPSAQVLWSETLLTFLLAASAWIVAASLQPTLGGSAGATRGKPEPHDR